jgi:serine/threonine-protein kinase
MTPPRAELVSALAGHYRIERELGAGGMATVYLAEDLKHRRKVAIKALHAELSALLGPERFLREIELTANLQHPHILPLFDSGSADGLLYYVMPYVDGETLRARLEREQQLPIADAVRIATEVADALYYAHERGVIHRDIKPENVLLQNGHALVADFGIALAVEQAGGARMTQTGLSLGTPQYMSPEQAMGERAVDGRTDIYALGAVTYEMIAGEPPFTGPNAQAIVAKVLTVAPEALSAKRATVPAAMEDAVAVALQKLPADRFSSAAAFAGALSNPSVSGATRPARTAVGRSRPDPRIVIAALTLTALLVGMGMTYGWQRTRSPSVSRGVVLSTLRPSSREEWGTSFALSPDGGRLIAVVRTGKDAATKLAIRPLDQLTDSPLPGTDGASAPFWSPDGKSIGFFADHRLKVIDLGSGTVRSLCPAPSGNSGSWSTKNVILYVPLDATQAYRVPAAGGTCTRLALRGIISTTGGTVQFLPDGEHFLVSSSDHTWLGRLESDSVTLLHDNNRSSSVFAAPDYLLFAGSDQSLTAQRIDLRAGALIGLPHRLLDRISHPNGLLSVSASLNGVLVAHTGPADGGRVVTTVGIGSVATDSLTIHENSWTYRLSHDGRRLALGGWALWTLDLGRGFTNVATSVPDSLRETMIYPVWSPDDTAIAFADSYGHYGVNLLDLRTNRVRGLFESPDATRPAEPQDWSPDGRSIAFLLRGARVEPWVYDVRTRSTHPLFAEQGDVSAIRYSPDGRWIAYLSNVTGSDEIYLRSLPPSGVPIRVSTAGGRMPRWRVDGRELYYAAPNEAVLAVAIGALVSGAISAPSAVVPVPPLGRRTYFDFDAMPDGGSFVFVLPPPEDPGLTLMQNWWARAGH